MSKVTYRTIPVKQIDTQRLLRQAGDGRIVIGVDVAKESRVAAIYVGLQRHAIVSWKAPTETRLFLLAVVGLGVKRVDVVLESTGTYSDALVHHLVQAGVSVYQVSSKHTHDLSESYDRSPSKHDGKDAGVIAELHLSGRSIRWRFMSDVDRTCRALVNLLHVYHEQEHANENRIEARCARSWPELPSILGLHLQTPIVLLETFGGPQMVAANEEEARALMRKTGGKFLSEDKIDWVIRSAHETTGVPMVLGECQEMKGLASEILRNRKEIQHVTDQLKECSAENECVRRLSPVVGLVTAQVLCAFLGDLQSYESPNSVVKAAGLNLAERSSGKHRGRLKITKRGAGKVRWYLFLAALRMIQNQPLFRAWHQKKVQRDGRRPKLLSVVALMRKLLKGLWHVARGAEFDAQKLFDARRLSVEQGESKRNGKPNSYGPGVCGNSTARPVPAPESRMAALPPGT